MHHIPSFMVHFQYTDIFVTTTYLVRTNMVVVTRVDCSPCRKANIPVKLSAISLSVMSTSFASF